ncbi:MAG: methyltransferase [Mucilaginibacter polytrichastri]|nr:methyltransferase [Mucilaginibacter polytrichastri]
MKSEPFHFKQFVVEQEGTTLKVNTDAVLLGALAAHPSPEHILDIGTGTGVIALMLAQRFSEAKVDAVEMDAQAAENAGRNFERSPFAQRLSSYPDRFQNFFENHPERRYDLIVSNPPYFIDALLSPNEKLRMAKHSGFSFFEELLALCAIFTRENGRLWLILPPDTLEQVAPMITKHNWLINKKIYIQDRPGKRIRRVVTELGKDGQYQSGGHFSIRDAWGNYDPKYCSLLRDFLTVF